MGTLPALRVVGFLYGLCVVRVLYALYALGLVGALRILLLSPARPLLPVHALAASVMRVRATAR
ncbi:hypothetical protein AB0J52_29615, partial [Spirillospora sp. NPDC049652]